MDDKKKKSSPSYVRVMTDMLQGEQWHSGELVVHVVRE